MKNLYNKNELLFSLVWIIIYIITMSGADYISSIIGTEKVVTAPLSILISIFLILFINKNNLNQKYGLCKSTFNKKQYLLFIPLIIIVSTNFIGNLGFQFTKIETILYVISMLSVGFIEEIIFRGFLFKSLCKESTTRAILISSFTFGLGHIVNLLNGAELLATILQILSAICIGFLFTIIFYKSGSLIPCIIAHGILNSLSAFNLGRPMILDILITIIISFVAVLYSFWILKYKNNNN